MAVASLSLQPEDPDNGTLLLFPFMTGITFRGGFIIFYDRPQVNCLPSTKRCIARRKRHFFDRFLFQGEGITSTRLGEGVRGEKKEVRREKVRRHKKGCRKRREYGRTKTEFEASYRDEYQRRKDEGRMGRTRMNHILLLVQKGRG